MKKYIVYIIVFFCFASFVVAETIQVATIERKPFVFKNTSGNLTGFSVELWKEIAQRNGYSFEYNVYRQFSSMLESVEKGETSLAIANISITSEREKLMDFSYPIYDSGIVVLIPKDGARPPLVKVLMSSWVLRSIAVIFLLFLATAHIIWLKDRSKDFSNYSESYMGVFQVGKKILLYLFSRDGRNTEISTRSIFIICAVVVLCVVSIFTSRFTSYTIVNSLQYKIQDQGDLQGVKLAVAEKTTMEEFAKRKNLEYEKYADFFDSVAAVETLKAEAALGSAATSKYYTSQQADKKIIIAGKIFQKDKLAIAFPSGSELRGDINKTLLQIQEDGTYQKLINKYFSD